MLLVYLLNCRIRTITRRVSISTPSRMTTKRGFHITCAVGAHSMRRFEVNTIRSKLRIVTNPCASSRSDCRVVGKRASSSSSMAVACALCTTGGNAFGVNTSRTIMKNEDLTSRTIEVAISNRTRRAGNTPDVRKRGDCSRPHVHATNSTVSNDSLFVGISTGGGEMRRRRPVLLACGMCARIRLARLRNGVPSLGKFRGRRMSLPRRGAFRARVIGNHPCGYIA